MPGPINPACLIMLAAETGTGNGPAIGDGDTIRYAGSRTRKLPIEIDVALASPGSSATVIVETSAAYGSGYTTWATIVLSSTKRTARFVGRVSNIYVRLRVSAQAGGGSVSAYMIRGS